MFVFAGVAVEVVNSAAGSSELFDDVVLLVSTLDIFKAVAAIAVLIGVAHRRFGTLLDDRLTLVRGGVGLLVATMGVRVSQEFLPFRARPLLNDSLDLVTIGALDEGSLESLRTSSSFPSDHAALMAALVVLVWWIDRRAGWWLLGYSTLFVLLPRVYMGFHYPSDILVGAMAGAAITAFCLWLPVPASANDRALGWLRAHPSLSLAIGFVAAYSAATLFYDARGLLDLVQDIATGTAAEDVRTAGGPR